MPESKLECGTDPRLVQPAQLVEEGVIAGGMIPKVECCVRCLAQGVAATHIIDGRQVSAVP